MRTNTTAWSSCVLVLSLIVAGAAVTAAAQVPAELVGSWQQGPLQLTLRKDGSYTWKDPQQTLEGRFEVEEAFLRLRYQGKTTPYMWAVTGNVLRLTGPKGGVVELQRASRAGGGGGPLGRDRVLGSWHSDRLGVDLVLNPDGSYSFARDHGRWQLRDGSLQMHSSSGGRAVYRVRIHEGQLQIMDEDGGVASFRRAGGSAPAMGGGEAPSSGLVGSWSAGGVDLALNADGTYRFGPSSGTYRVRGDALLLYYQGRPTTYHFRVAGGALVLTDPSGNSMRFERRR